MFAWEHAQDAALVLLLGGAVVDDVRRKRISNWLTGPGFLVGCLLAFLAGGVGTANSGLLGALAGALAAGGLFVFLWLFTHGIGGGDAKLMLAVGALVGFPQALGVLLFVAVAGGVQGMLVVVASRPRVRKLLVSMGVGAAKEADFGKKVRYGLAIAAGTVAFRLWAAWPDAG